MYFGEYAILDTFYSLKSFYTLIFYLVSRINKLRIIYIYVITYACRQFFFLQ